MSEKTASLHRTFGSQVFAFGLIQITQRLRGFIVFALLTRLIGAYGYGLLAPLWALSGFALTLILPGTNTALTVLLPGLPREERRRDFWAIFQSTAVLAALVTLSLAVGVAFVRQRFLPQEFPDGAYFLGILIIPLSAFQTLLHAQMTNNYEGRAYVRIIAFIAVADVILLAAGAFWLNIYGVLCATLISQFLLCSLLIMAILKNDSFVKFSRDMLPRLKRYYAYGLTIFFSGLAGWAIGSSDRLILARNVDATQLGIYAAIYNLCSQINQLASPFYSALMPFIAEAISRKDVETAHAHLERSGRILLFLIAPVVIIFIFAGKDVVQMLATKEFVQGIGLIPYLAVGVALWQMKGIYSYNIHAHRRSELLIFSTVVGAVINIGLNLVFTPKYGIRAAALATLCAYAAVFFIDRYISNRFMKIVWKPTFIFKLALITAATIASMMLSQEVLKTFLPIYRLIVVLLVSMTAYFGLSLYWKLFEPIEIKALFDVGRSFLPQRQ